MNDPITITTIIHNIIVSLPSTVPPGSKSYDYIKYLEHHSYVEGFYLQFKHNDRICRTSKLFDSNLLKSLIRYTEKIGFELTLTVYPTTNELEFNLIAVEYHNNFTPPFYTTTYEFQPKYLVSRSCSLDTYKNFSYTPDTPLPQTLDFIDPTYEGDPTLTMLVSINGKISTISDSPASHYYIDKIKSAIRSQSKLKGIFEHTPKRLTLLNLI